MNSSFFYDMMDGLFGNGSVIEDSGDRIKDYMMTYIYTINMALFCGVFSIIGIVTNIINIIIFRRQNFQETINISLFALSVSDFCSLVASLFFSIGYNPFFMYSSLPIISTDIHFPGGWTHFMFNRISGLITVFITFERCMCIMFPLRVKIMLSPKRVKLIIIAIYTFAISNHLPGYFTYYYGWKYVPRLNRTMFGIIRTTYSPTLLRFVYGIQPFYPVFSFTAVLLCSYILIYKLRQRAKWRNATATSHSNDKSLNRDQQVVKMVVYVAIIFIVSYIPSLLLFCTILVNPEMNMRYKYENSFVLFLSFAFIFDNVNSTVNIIAYYKASSAYRQQFKKVILKRQIAN